MIVLLLWRSPKTTCWCVYFFLPWKIPSCLVGSAVPGDLTSISACLAICSREMFTSGAGTSMACRLLCAVWYLFSAASGLSPAVVCIRGWACHFSSSFTLLAILLLQAGGSKFRMESSWADRCQSLWEFECITLALNGALCLFHLSISIDETEEGGTEDLFKHCEKWERVSSLHVLCFSVGFFSATKQTAKGYAFFAGFFDFRKLKTTEFIWHRNLL